MLGWHPLHVLTLHSFIAFKRDEEPPGQQSGDLQAQWKNLLQDHVSLLERSMCILTAEEETCGTVTSNRYPRHGNHGERSRIMRSSLSHLLNSDILTGVTGNIPVTWLVKDPPPYFVLYVT